MAKNSFCSPVVLPEDQSCHANIVSTIQELPANTDHQYHQGCASVFTPGPGVFHELRGAGTSKSHRLAEKRRRDRINAQLARLRKLIPMSEKMDKAALLGRVVEQVRDLKKKASEISKLLTIPTETDEVAIECHTNNINQQGSHISHDKSNTNTLFKATFCCEDRPDLIAELIRALKGLNLTTIEADMTSLGGRMKSILILYKKDDGSLDKGDDSNVIDIKQSIMEVLSRMVSWSTTTPNFRVTSKRQRFFFSH